MKCENCNSENTKWKAEGGDTLFECNDCGLVIENGIETKKEININNAEHPARRKAIAIMEYIAEYLGKPDIFDCNKEKQTTTWYDVEDKLTNIIEGKE